MFQQMFFFKQIKHLAYRCTGQWIAAISGSMIPGNKRCRSSLFVQDKCSHRNSAAKCFGTCHHIRLHTVRLESKHCPCSSHTALNLIQNQKNAFLITQFSYTCQELRISRIDTSLSLYGFHDNCTGFIRDLLLYTFQIIKFRKTDSADQRLKRLLIMGVSGNRKCSQASSVEGMFHGNDFMICTSILQISIFSCHLDSSLNGFRSTVGKKYSGHAGCFYQLFCCFCHRNIIVKIGCMDYFINLVFQGLTIFRMIVPKSKHSDTSCKIQILLSLNIIQPDSLTFFQYNLKTVIRMQNHLFCPVNIFLTARHNLSSHPFLK